MALGADQKWNRFQDCTRDVLNAVFRNTDLSHSPFMSHYCIWEFSGLSHLCNSHVGTVSFPSCPDCRWDIFLETCVKSHICSWISIIILEAIGMKIEEGASDGMPGRPLHSHVLVSNLSCSPIVYIVCWENFCGDCAWIPSLQGSLTTTTKSATRLEQIKALRPPWYKSSFPQWLPVCKAPHYWIPQIILQTNLVLNG